MPPAKYDINTVSIKELLELGFSQEMAERLIKEREARKGFKSVKEAAEVLGIHPREMLRFQAMFYVAPEPEPWPELDEPGGEPDPADREDWKLVFTVRTDPALSPEAAEKIRLRLDYQATGEEGRVSELYQILLQQEYMLEVDPFPLVSELNATVENRQGLALVPQQFLVPEVDKEHFLLKAELKLSGEDLKKALHALRPETIDSMIRAGRFMVAGMPEASFEGFHLSMDLVDSQAKEDALGRIFPLKERQTPSVVREIDLLDQDVVSAFSGFDLTAAEKLKYDGRFSFSRVLPEKGADTVRGWIWFLNGPLMYAGYRREQDPHSPARDLIILLPGSEKASHLMSQEPCGEHLQESGSLPLDVDEEHLLRDSKMFHDDPGPFCKPFSNPSRILGERSFRTVLRVEQPEIALTSPNKPDYTRLFPKQPALDFYSKAYLTPGQWLGKSSHLLRLLPGTPPGLSTLSLFPKKLQRPSRRRPVSSRNPVDWDEDPTRHQALSLAGGHILEWRVQWRSNGYSLGDVKRTLTLAPRQTRRIVKVDWTRTEWARRDETLVSADEFDEGAERAMDYGVAVSSSLQEWSRGGSRASTTGAAGGIGFALGPVVVGGGAAHGRASSSSWQEGGRQVAASEQQRLREAIRQYGDSLRSLESTVVTEAEQHEAVQGVSEVIRNPNYCHSLSVVYYEILRHLRVDTVLGGVRECLFVPFSITLFDLERVLQWRGALQRYLRRRELRWALAHSEKVLAVKEARETQQDIDAAWGDIPAGRRAGQPVRYLSGSVSIRLGIEIPNMESLDDETLEKMLEDRERMYNLLLSPFAALLGRTVAETAREMVEAKEARIQDYFRREIAPFMARNWVESLNLFAGNSNYPSKLTGTVFSMASGYRHKGVHRVDFTVPLSTLEEEGVTRFMLKKVTVSAGADLPAGSVADCMQLRFVYETEQDKGRAASSWYTRRLVRSDSGTAGEEAELNLPLSSYEKQEPRKEILKAFDSILDHLNTNLHYYHKAIWWSMDRDELYTILDGYSVSGTDSRSIASVVEREPIAILGNSLVFPVAAGAFLGIDGHDSLQDLFNYYCQESQGSTPMRISLPTDGVYAQALKDQCHACEEHQGSTDWVLQDKDPELAELPPELLASRYQKPQDLQPSQFPEAIINNINLPQTPQAQGLEQAITAAGKKDAFRDMAGLEGTQKNAAAAMQKASDLAGRFGETAAAYNLARRSMDQDGLDRVMSSLEKWGERFDVPKEELGNIFTKFMENLSGESGKDVTEILEKLAQAIKSMSPGQTATITSLDGEKLFNIVLGQDSSGKEDDSQDEDQEDQEEEGEENNDKEDQEDGGENGEKEDAEEE